MNCLICKTGVTQPGRTVVTLNREGVTVVIKGVPAEICGTCGEYYLDQETTSVTLSIAESAAARGAEVEVLQYRAGVTA